MSVNRDIQLGLCCKNTVLSALKGKDKVNTRTFKLGSGYNIDYIQNLCRENVKDVIKMIEWNEANGIKVFRLSSDLFPHIANPLHTQKYTLDCAKDLLKEAGDLAKKYNMRITFHPCQCVVLASPNKDAYDKSVMDLDYHSSMLDYMGIGPNGVMVVHGGGLYGNKQETVERWISNYNKLPLKIKKRLVLENCEKCYSIEDCLYISSQCGVPVVFDTHHFTCYNQLHPKEQMKFKEEYYIPLILETWKNRLVKPKFHVSEQGSGRTGHHSDYIETIPEFLLEIPKKYGVSIDIMIEAKMKEQAIFRLYQKYPYLNCKRNTNECSNIDIECTITIS